MTTTEMFLQYIEHVRYMRTRFAGYQLSYAVWYEASIALGEMKC